ncbi:hypothetical protein quinque_008451 [Culex quinquefasciatus]
MRQEAQSFYGSRVNSVHKVRMLVPLRAEDLNSGFTGKKCLPPTQPPVLHQIRILNEFQNDNAMTQEPQDKDARQKELPQFATSSGVSSEPPMEEIDR